METTEDEPLHACKRWEEGEPLGEGASGKVWLVTDIQTEKQYAKKIITIKSEKEIVEAEYLKLSNHEHITKYIEHEVVREGGQKKLVIYMEYAEKGALSRQPLKEYSEKEKAEIVFQVLMALKYIHDQNVIHRDVKLENIFLTKDGKAKLGDFGICRHHNNTSEKKTTGKGSPETTAPEVIRGNNYTCTADIWSLGCVAMALMNGDYVLCEGEIKAFEETNSEKYPAFWNFFQQTRKEAKERPSSTDLLYHEWFYHCRENVKVKIENLLNEKRYNEAIPLLESCGLKFNIKLHSSRPSHKRLHCSNDDEGVPPPKFLKPEVESKTKRLKRIKTEDIKKFKAHLLDIAERFEDVTLAEDAGITFDVLIEKIPDTAEHLYKLAKEEYGSENKHCYIPSIIFYLSAIKKSLQSTLGCDKRILAERAEVGFCAIAGNMDQYVRKYPNANMQHLLSSVQKVFHTFREELGMLSDNSIKEMLGWCEIHIASIYSLLKDYHIVLTICKKFWNEYKPQDHLSAKTHHLTAAAYYNLNSFEDALDSFKRAKEDYKRLNFNNKDDILNEIDSMIEACQCRPISPQ